MCRISGSNFNITNLIQHDRQGIQRLFFFAISSAPARTGGAEGHQQDQPVAAPIAVWKHQAALEER